MNKMCRSRVALLIILSVAVITYSQQPKGPLEEANQLHNNRQYSKAVEAYVKLLAETADIPTRAKIIFNLGVTYRMLKDYDRSIQSFKEILAMDVDDREPGGHIMELRRNYRPRSQREIGNTLFAKSDYAEALSAFRTARTKYPMHTGCGTCQVSIERRNNIIEGITLEALGRYSEAVVFYLKADEPHLAELYFKSGQLEDLREIVESNIAELMRKHSWQRYYAIQNSPYRNLIASIAAYDLEKAANWPELIKLAHVYARDREFGRNNIPAMLLARHFDKVWPLLKNEMGKFTLVSQNGVIYEILALSGTVESIALLNELIPKHGPSHESYFALARIYRLADEKGKARLRGVKAIADPAPHARHFFERDDIDELGRFEIKFPHMGNVPKLPGSVEIQRDLF